MRTAETGALPTSVLDRRRRAAQKSRWPLALALLLFAVIAAIAIGL